MATSTDDFQHMKRFLFPTLFAIVAAAAPFLTNCSQSRPQEADLVLLYTTDVHGACLPYDFSRGHEARFSLSNVSSYVQQERAQHPDAVMLFDTGDYLQGQPSIYYHNFVDTTTTHIVAQVANYMGYDALGIGNHDIEAGEAVYEKRMPIDCQMPLLCANAIDTRTGKPMFHPYTIVERQGIRVAVLGMITPNVPAWLPQALWPNLEFQDMTECAAHWLPIIQKEEKPDLIVGLFHSGGDYTTNGNTLDSYKNENGGIPAATKVPGFDIILLGHDHELRQTHIVNVAGDTVHVLDARSAASCVGRADIHLTWQGNGYCKQITTAIVPMDDVTPDSAFNATFAEQINTINHYIEAPLGTLTGALQASPSLFGPSEFMDFIHDVQLWATGADVSFAGLLSAHAVVEPGTLTMRHLFTLYKYENLMYKLSMTGDEIRQYLEYGYSKQFAVMKSAKDHLLAYVFDADGNIQRNSYGARTVTPTFNYTSAAGIRYTVDVSRPVGSRVQIHSMTDGTPFDPAKRYVVAVNSYQASGGGGFLPDGLGWDKATIAERTMTTTTKDVRSYVADYIKHHGTIRPHLRNEWQVIPHAWWKEGSKKDMKLMNPNMR